MESEYSNEASATPADTTAPAAPSNLVATAGDSEVSLYWDDNTEPDLEGYNVYRSETQGTGYSKINTAIVTVSEYTDSDVQNGTTYYYVVTALDEVPNESGYSNEASATPGDAVPPAAPTNVAAQSKDTKISRVPEISSDAITDEYGYWR